MTKLKIKQQTQDPVLNIALDTINKNKQALIFVNTKRSAEKTAEDIANYFKKLKQKGYTAKNMAIDLNPAIEEGYNVIIPTNGMVGNQIFRVLLFCGGKILSATRLGLSRMYEDNSRTEKDFEYHVKWITALINKRKSKK